MQIIPEIQIHDYKLTTRSVSAGNQIVHDSEPTALAKEFENQGAEWLHVVDVNAARGEDTDNGDIIRKIVQEASIPVQVAGGIRTLAQIDGWFEVGAARVVLGTVAITDHHLIVEAAGKYPGGIVVNLTTQDNVVMINGWRDKTSFSAKQLVHDLQLTGIAGIIHTDIDRFEGHTSGTMALTTELCRELSIPVYSSGTVHSLDDLARVRYLPNIHGAIIGHALVSRVFTLSEAMDVVAQVETSPEPETLHSINKAGLNSTTVTRAYFAGYSQSQAERWWNRSLRESIMSENPYVDVVIPQDEFEQDADRLSARELQKCYERELERSDVVIAMLDSIQNGAWTGFEFGFGKAMGKQLIGICKEQEKLEGYAAVFAEMCDQVVSFQADDDLLSSIAIIAEKVNRELLARELEADSA